MRNLHPKRELIDIDLENFNEQERAQPYNKLNLIIKLYVFFTLFLFVFAFLLILILPDPNEARVSTDGSQDTSVQFPKDQKYKNGNQGIFQDQEKVDQIESGQDQTSYQDSKQEETSNEVRQQAPNQRNCTNFCEFFAKCSKQSFDQADMKAKFLKVYELYKNSPYNKQEIPFLSFLNQQDYHLDCKTNSRCSEFYSYNEISCLPVFIMMYQSQRDSEENWQYVDIYAPSQMLISQSYDTKFAKAANTALKEAEKWIKDNQKDLIDILIY